MTTSQELRSWFVPGVVDPRPVPNIGDKAPSLPKLSFPRPQNKSTLIAFLRHCGCPCTQNISHLGDLSNSVVVAEKVFLSLRKLAEQHQDIEFVAISHSDQSATDKWVENIGGPGGVTVIVDNNRQIYGAFGLGISSIWHALNPWSLISVIKLGRTEGIWNRPTESGSRWQTAGIFAVDAKCIIQYAHVAQAADDLGDLETALKALSG